jgi:hypothetical protein
MAPSVLRQNSVARASHGWPATAGSNAATRYAAVATIAVICSDDRLLSADAQKGAQAAGSDTGIAKGRPPSGRVMPASHSQTSTARGVVDGAASANASKACSAPAGWLDRERRSGSRPHP